MAGYGGYTYSSSHTGASPRSYSGSKTINSTDQVADRWRKPIMSYTTNGNTDQYYVTNTEITIQQSCVYKYTQSSPINVVGSHLLAAKTCSFFGFADGLLLEAKTMLLGVQWLLQDPDRLPATRINLTRRLSVRQTMRGQRGELADLPCKESLHEPREGRGLSSHILKELVEGRLHVEMAHPNENFPFNLPSGQARASGQEPWHPAQTILNEEQCEKVEFEGHKTDDCFTLKDAIEEAMQNGELVEFVN
ncbi:hypothetical protein Gogos_000820 [Gossypium gossypioides]|uniref:Uncharacterized protein n=1 Tax=Gossypium gossypioides TaxID=34282 RepID=A0A7J9CU11_GOSGO|nr:hypothetical protein [Gossypium gossypioides]